MDRENVIKFLEEAETMLTHSVDHGGEMSVIRALKCLRRVTDAIVLLKEQEPIKPYVDIDEYKCPICKVKLTRQELLGDDVLFEDYFDYCPKCGRKVDWIVNIYTNDDQRAGQNGEQSRGAADAAQD